MLVIPASMHIPLDAKQDLLNGSHFCRHSEGADAVSMQGPIRRADVYQTGEKKLGD